MKFRLISTPPSMRDVRAIFQWLEARSPQGADRWLDAYENALIELEADPLCHGLAAESAYFEFDLGEKFFRTQQGRRYRLLYTVQDEAVRLLRVRGPGQPPIGRKEVV